MSLESFFAPLGYGGVFALVLVVNVVPAFMPPTWAVLSLLYISMPEYFAPLPLALVGCTASTFGRIILSYTATAGRRFMGEKRRHSLESLRNKLESKKGGGFLLSLAIALSPLPSNAYFLAVGIMKYQVVEVFAGFMLGRFLLYWGTVSLARVAAHSFEELFSNELLTIAVIDLLGIASAILLAIIDWQTLIEERRLAIIRPEIRRHRER